jgi:ABC-2 type transport system ATP-binding protein
VRREVFKRLSERGWAILGLKSSELSLEDVFLQLTDDNNKQTFGVQREETISLDEEVFESDEADLSAQESEADAIETKKEDADQ